MSGTSYHDSAHIPQTDGAYRSPSLDHVFDDDDLSGGERRIELNAYAILF